MPGQIAPQRLVEILQSRLVYGEKRKRDAEERAKGVVQSQEQSRWKKEKSLSNASDEEMLEIARLKLEALGVEIDELTDEQKAYLMSWEHGT